MTTFFLKTKSENNLFELLLFFVTILLVIYTGVLYEPDSHAFLAKDIDRSPGYILFLTVFTTTFGDHYEYPVLVIQLFLNLYGVWLLHTYIKRTFNFTKLLSFFSLFVLLAPVLYLHFTANKILGEALCYPLYLIFLTKLFQGCLGDRKKQILNALITLTLLIFVRSQFLFLIPVIIVFSGYLFYKNRDKTYLWSILGVVLIPILVNFMNKSYHYLMHGHFISTPATGHVLASSVFYVADEEDYELFSSDVERNYFKKVKQKLDRNQWSNDHASRYDSIQIFEWYKINYPNICNETIHGIGMEYFKQEGLSRDEQFIATSELATRMYKPLLFDNLKKWIKLYIYNIKAALGSTKNLLLHIFILVVGMFLVIKDNSKLGKVVAILVMCTLANIALLAVATHAIKRYTFYNDWVVFITVFIFINEYLKNRTRLSG